MLQAIREGAQGFFAWVILILITIPFALWGVQNYVDSGNEASVVAVNGQEFSQNDVSRAVQSLQQRYNDALQSGLMSEEQLRRQAIDGLVLEAVLSQEILKRKMVLSDSSVQENVMGMEAFQTDRQFDKRRYENLLSARGLSSQGFIERIRQSLAIEQLQKGISQSAFVTNASVKDFYRLRNQERTVEYFIIPKGNDEEGESVSEAEVSSYYRSHIEDFQTEEELSVEYVELSAILLADAVSVDDEAVKQVYEEQKNGFIAEEKRKVSHILFTIADLNDEAGVLAAKEKAIQAKAKLDSGEKFALLAKTLSEDPGTADVGGDLGYIERGVMEKPFESAAYRLDLEAVSEPVQTRYGFHLIKVNEIVAKASKSFDEVRVEISETLKRELVENLLYEKLEQMEEIAFENPDSLKPIAEQLGLTIQESSVFSRNVGAGLAADPRFRRLAFSEEVLKNRNSEPLEVSAETAIVLHLKTHKEAGSKSLSEVRDEVIVFLKKEKVAQQLDQRAEALIEELKKGKRISELALSQSAELKSPGSVLRDNRKLPVELLSALFMADHPTDENKIIPLWVSLEKGGQIIASLQKVSDGDPSKVESQELEMAEKQLGIAAGQSQLEASLLSLRNRAEIKIVTTSEY